MNTNQNLAKPFYKSRVMASLKVQFKHCWCGQKSLINLSIFNRELLNNY